MIKMWEYGSNTGLGLVKMSGSNSCAPGDLCRFFAILKQSDHVPFPAYVYVHKQMI